MIRRVAVVIGGTSESGGPSASGLAEAGADVVATGRRQELVNDIAAEVEARGTESPRPGCPKQGIDRRIARRDLKGVWASHILVKPSWRVILQADPPGYGSGMEQID